ncbi:MAG: hypothetical protein PHD56_14600, partial [Anaerostipes sp.]|nr:hypothetical protein [Anaerostipes sp.]
MAGDINVNKKTCQWQLFPCTTANDIAQEAESNGFCFLCCFALCVQQSWTTLAGVSPVAVITSEPCSQTRCVAVMQGAKRVG